MKKKSEWDKLKEKGSGHYKVGVTGGRKVEPIDLIKEFGMLPGFALGNIIKYVCRYKPGDLDKIAHYTQMLIVLEREERKNEADSKE